MNEIFGIVISILVLAFAVSPANPSAHATFINFLITMGTNTTQTVDFGQPLGTQTFYRTTNTFGSLPQASAATAVSGTGPTGTPGVPDGGATVMLLGAALGALGMARRFLKA